MTLIHGNRNFHKLKEMGEVAEGLDVAMGLVINKPSLASISGHHQTSYISVVDDDDDDDETSEKDYRGFIIVVILSGSKRMWYFGCNCLIARSVYLCLTKGCWMTKQDHI